MRRKHRKDHNHGKRGWVGGNPRYNGKATTNMTNYRPKRTRLYRKGENLV